MAGLEPVKQFIELKGEGTVTDVPVRIVLQKLVDIFGYSEVSRVLKTMKPVKNQKKN